MIARLTYLILLLTLGVNTYAQNWVPLGGGAEYMVRGIHVDETSNKLYAYGLFNYIGDSVLVNFIAEWNGNEWKDLNGGHNSSNHPITGVLSYDEDILVYGQFPTFNDAMDAKFNARWDGVEWSSFAEVNGAVLFNNYKDSLLAFGTFDTISGVEISGGLALYDGTVWHDFDTMQFHNGNNGYILNTAAYQNELYVAGNFNRPNGLKEIAKWDGEKFIALEDGIFGDSWVSKMLVYKNELYVAGHFFKDDGNLGNGIMKWDGENWSDLNKGLEMTSNGHVRDMVVFEDDLIISGVFYSADDLLVQNLVRWDGEKFCDFRDDYRGTASKMAVYNNELIVTCRDTMDGDSTHWIAKWVGGNQTTDCGELLSLDGQEGYQSNQVKSQLVVSPNPTNGQVLFDYSDQISRVEVYDLMGKLVFYDAGVNENKLQIDLSPFENGIYNFKLFTKESMINGKIVKN